MYYSKNTMNRTAFRVAKNRLGGKRQVDRPRCMWRNNIS